MSNNLPALMPLQEVQTMAQAAAKSGLFGVKTSEQAFALMLVAQAEGLHPMTACQTYDIIQGRPSMKATAMLSRFQQAGGKVVWSERSDKRACATFSHPAGGSVEVEWTLDRAKAADLGTKDMWRKYPRQMLSARTISEGVRTVYPAVLGGFYAPEEVQDFDAPRDVTPPKPVRADFKKVEPAPTKEVIDAETGEILPPSGSTTGKELSPEPAAAGVDWNEWARVAAADIERAISVEHLDDWCDANADAMTAFTTAHRDRGERLQKFIDKRRDALSAAAA